MRERFKPIVELISLALSVFAIHRETVAELAKLDPSPEQQAILARFKGPLVQMKSRIQGRRKDVFGIMARIGRRAEDWRLS
jgi:hypothetical protein